MLEEYLGAGVKIGAAGRLMRHSYSRSLQIIRALDEGGAFPKFSGLQIEIRMKCFIYNAYN